MKEEWVETRLITSVGSRGVLFFGNFFTLTDNLWYACTVNGESSEKKHGDALDIF